MKVYYAHAKYLYRTDQERKEIKQIRRNFPRIRILNPRNYQEFSKDDVMGYYKKLLSECDLLTFSRLAGKITAGVGEEVNHALSLGKPVYELKSGKTLPVKKQVRYLSIDDTLNLFERLSIRKKSQE